MAKVELECKSGSMPSDAVNLNQFAIIREMVFGSLVTTIIQRDTETEVFFNISLNL